MNKVFSSNQRKDKDMITGQYNHAVPESIPVSDTGKSRWPLIAACVIVLAIVAAVIFL